MRVPFRIPNILCCAALSLAGSCAGTPASVAVSPTRVDVRGLAVPDAAMIAAREQTADQQVLHALNRLGFGPRPGDVEQVRAIGVDPGSPRSWTRRAFRTRPAIR